MWGCIGGRVDDDDVECGVGVMWYVGCRWLMLMMCEGWGDVDGRSVVWVWCECGVCINRCFVFSIVMGDCCVIMFVSLSVVCMMMLYLFGMMCEMKVMCCGCVWCM